MNVLLNLHNSVGGSRKASLSIVAHRGGGALRPENTMAAFHHAVTLGAHALELDIHGTADGEIVVSHDPRVDRTTNGSGRIAELTLAQLKSLDAGYRFQPLTHYPAARQPGDEHFPERGAGRTVPALRELFDAFPAVPMVIDIKQRTPDITAAFAALIRRYRREAITVVGSFHTDTLMRFRKAAPDVPTCLSANEVKRLLFSAKLRLAWAVPAGGHMASVPPVSGRWRVITRRFVEGAHRRGIAVSAWTINELSEAKRLGALGVDSIVTDVPDVMLRHFA